MYKIIVNENDLFITEKPVDAEKVISYKPFISFNEIIKLLWDNKVTSLNIYHHDLKKLWDELISNFRCIKSAGGLVYNKYNHILFIYKLKKWDLPKGRVEKFENYRETALREVKEECGITNVKIIKKLKNTYHIFYQKKFQLKITYWYKMYTEELKLNPDIKENISKAVWKNKNDLKNIIKNTYKNIKYILDYESNNLHSNNF